MALPRGFTLEPADKIQLQQFYGSLCMASLLFNLLCIMSCVVHLSYVDPLSELDAIKFFLMRIDSLGDPIVFMVESCIFFMGAVSVWVLGTFGLALALQNFVCLIIFIAGNAQLWAKTSAFAPSMNLRWTQDPSLWAAEDIMYGLKKRSNNAQVVSFVQKFGKVVLEQEQQGLRPRTYDGGRRLCPPTSMAQCGRSAPCCGRPAPSLNHKP
ncbi:AASDH [Symbiodinium sp. CCMP2456]|nr:AASDH [Symbiodinium sp. CCMP2456]